MSKQIGEHSMVERELTEKDLEGVIGGVALVPPNHVLLPNTVRFLFSQGKSLEEIGNIVGLGTGVVRSILEE